MYGVPKSALPLALCNTGKPLEVGSDWGWGVEGERVGETTITKKKNPQKDEGCERKQS